MYTTANLEVSGIVPIFATRPTVRAPRYRSVFTAETVSASEKATVTTFVLVTTSAMQRSAAEGRSDFISARDIEISAGTFGDPSRYLQTLAGVAADNDQRNDFLVRGGNPAENLFVIDNIDIPSINQLALSTTTGGLVSMLDASAMQSLTLHTDAYDSHFDQRLSSVVEISTRPLTRPDRQNTSEIGIGGMGGSATRPFGSNGSYFVSARQSVLHYFTNDIGLNGVPIYRNAFFRFENTISAKDQIWGISLTGIDSLKSHGDVDDLAETTPLDINYLGWRNTSGLNLRHVFSPNSFTVASIAYAEQSQHIQQNDQLQADATIYDEKTADRTATTKLDWTLQAGRHILFTTGVRAALDQINYVVQQPIGLVSPYLSNPTPLNVTGFNRRFAAGSSAVYGQALFTFAGNASLAVGERVSQWALGGNHASDGKIVFSKLILGKAFHASVAEYDQMPTTLYLLSFNNISSLKPIHALTYATGVTLMDDRKTRVTVGAYQKLYSHYPTSANIPELSLANIADTFGQAFLTFPMVGIGKGVARGAELTIQTRLLRKVDLAGNLTYARNWYSGTDGILRRGSYDLPLSSNLSAVWTLPKHLTVSGRFTATSGRPYTPDDLAASIAQNRDVYDITKINGLRSTMYARLDFRVEQAVHLGRGTMLWHAGLQNALNRQNFYAYLWQPRYLAEGFPAQSASAQYQMPMFPDGGVKYIF